MEHLRISPLDRGFLFADGIYEVVPVHRNRLLVPDLHYTRLCKNLQALSIEVDLTASTWLEIIGQLHARNPDASGVYFQITRGVEPVRSHLPSGEVYPTLFGMPLPGKGSEAPPGQRARTTTDYRWHYCNIKSTALLGNILARNTGADVNEVILIRDGWLTEGTSTNVFVVRNGTILTPRADWRILPGITRDLLLEFGRQSGWNIAETDILKQDVFRAEEIWLTSSTRIVQPLLELDDNPVGTGRPGAIWERISPAFTGFLDQLAES